MRFKATIWFSLKAILVQWKQVLLMYAIFPLLLSTSMGYFQKDVFKPETSIDKINITIIDEDNSEASKGFTRMFKSEGIKDLFNVTEDGQYLITIPDGYQEGINNLRDVSIRVDEKERVSRTNELIIKAVVEQYGKHLTKSITISNKIESLEVVDKEKLYNEVITSINRVTALRTIKNNPVKGERTLSSYENQAATLMTYMVIMMIMGCVAGHHLDLENGSFRRLMSTPMRKTTMYNLNFTAFFVATFIYGMVYIVTLRVVGYAFKGVSVLNLGAILIGQSFLIAACAGLMTAFFNKKNANIVLIIIMYYQIIFGGVFIPLKDITSRAFMLLSRFSPGNVISSAYRNCILFNSFNKISEYLLIMLLSSLAAYIISIIKVRIRWEE
ncbi:MAG: family transporter protein [Clostridiales bacterium]|nr:family transporter protein [Clostridiales bacterium]